MASPRPRAVVAGAGGFIGEALVASLTEDGYDVVTVGRSGPVRWDDPARVARVVDGADLVVNLAGKSVDCRYTDTNRDEILRSRVDTTRTLRGAVAAAAHPPRLWLNSSTATIYRHAMDRPNDESTGDLGSGFSVDVAKAWEREFFAGDLPATRRVALRLAIVVGDGPATRMLLTLARTGFGGPQHDGWVPPHRRYRGVGVEPTGDRPSWYRTRGRQRFSWVHIDDVLAAIRFLDQRPDIAGVVNVAVPEASDNRTLMRTLRRVVGIPVGIPSQRWMLEIAMWALRTEPELILKSRWVVPERLLAAGFRFAHTDLEDALRGVARVRPRRERPRRSARS
jgi:NAD dependent epimerase/dehydratase family enzyme